MWWEHFQHLLKGKHSYCFAIHLWALSTLFSNPSTGNYYHPLSFWSSTWSISQLGGDNNLAEAHSNTCFLQIKRHNVRNIDLLQKFYLLNHVVITFFIWTHWLSYSIFEFDYTNFINSASKCQENRFYPRKINVSCTIVAKQARFLIRIVEPHGNLSSCFPLKLRCKIHQYLKIIWIFVPARLYGDTSSARISKPVFLVLHFGQVASHSPTKAREETRRDKLKARRYLPPTPKISG